MAGKDAMQLHFAVAMFAARRKWRGMWIAGIAARACQAHASQQHEGDAKQVCA
jgi:hypothetical protein